MTAQETIWGDDELERLPLARKVVQLIGTMKCGGVFGLDAPFGFGKTFFVTRVAADLKRAGHPVFVFDAWKADLSDRPLFLFVTEFLSALAESGIKATDHPSFGDSAKDLASAVLRIGAKTLLRAGDDDLDALLEPLAQEIDRIDWSKAGAAAEALKLADDVSVARAAFERVVQRALVADGCTLPLVVFIDELDRARPDFAVELIEALKFVFASGNVVFCLSADRKNLSETIKARYGAEYNVRQYLARIVQFWVPLQNPVSNFRFLAGACKALLDDGFLVDTDDFHKGLETSARFACLALGDEAANPRSLQRCAEIMGLGMRSLSPKNWAGLVGYLSGLAIADRPTLDLISQKFVGETVSDADVNELATKTANYPDWHRLMVFACVLTSNQAQMAGPVLSARLGPEQSEDLQSVVREMRMRRGIHFESPAQIILKEIGWILG